MQVGPMAFRWAWLFVSFSIFGCDSYRRVDSAPLQRVRVSQFHMGMMVHLTLWAPTVEEGQQAAAAAFERIGQIDQIMSDYEPASELSRLCRQSGQGPVPVSDELFEVLAAAYRFAELTDGRYDPTVGPLTRLWRKARQTKIPPSRSAIDAALEQVGYQEIVLNADAQTVELTHPDMWLDLGSIAKGYAGDQAIRILKEHDIPIAAYEAGGDKVFGDAPPGKKGWPVIANPKLPPIANCAVSISGDSAQFMQYDGRRMGHVIDPRTGSGFLTRTTCTVIAQRGVDSDPLATIGVTMPPMLYRMLLKQHFPTVDARVVESSDSDRPDDPRIPPP